MKWYLVVGYLVSVRVFILKDIVSVWVFSSGVL